MNTVILLIKRLFCPVCPACQGRGSFGGGYYEPYEECEFCEDAQYLGGNYTRVSLPHWLRWHVFGWLDRVGFWEWWHRNDEL